MEVPRSKPRPKSTTRMDVISLMLKDRKSTITTIENPIEEGLEEQEREQEQEQDDYLTLEHRDSLSPITLPRWNSDDEDSDESDDELNHFDLMEGAFPWTGFGPRPDSATLAPAPATTTVHAPTSAPTLPQDEMGTGSGIVHRLTTSRLPHAGNMHSNDVQQPPPCSQEQQHHAGSTTSPSSSTPASPIPSKQERCDEQQETCSPRFLENPSTLPPQPRRRPRPFNLDDTHGHTTVSPDELRHCIRTAAAGAAHAPTAACITRTQLIEYAPLQSPQPLKRKPVPKTPASVQSSTAEESEPSSASTTSSTSSSSTMGNQHSHHTPDSSALGDDSDTRSHSSVVRNSKPKGIRVPRRSSMNVLKKHLEGRSPLPEDFTSTTVEVPRAATAPNLDGAFGDDELSDETQVKQRQHSINHRKRHSAPSPSPFVLRSSPPCSPRSPVTIKGSDEARPRDSCETITERSYHEHEDDEDANSLPQPTRRIAILSPTLPAPSPLPEDSPHKYGLRDTIDTPEPLDEPSPDSDIKIAKNRRRSSGLEIFKEARSLQSASSFLNGLSTARRRAESRAQSRTQSRNATDSTETTTGTATTFNSYPSASAMSLSNNTVSSRSQPSLPSPSNLALPSNSHSRTDAAADYHLDALVRHSGHTHKSSGFAYSRPLALTQIKCFRNHDRLLLSHNKYSPVECAICHVDDEREHWSCSWCAVRICGGCRRDFDTRGVGALRERVRMAEMGEMGEWCGDGRGGEVAVY